MSMLHRALFLAIVGSFGCNPPFCGDGVVDEGEECDDGDDNAATCEEPSCTYCSTTCEVETTPPAQPEVVSTDPANEEPGVAVTTAVTATFSVPMDPATVDETTFLLSVDGVAVPGTVSLDYDVATFVPAEPLAFDTPYDAMIAAEVESTDGVALIGSHQWQFTTRPGIKAVGMGTFFGCAIRTDDSLVCWGDNDGGQLGTGLTALTATVPRPTPVASAGTDVWVQVDAGDKHACGVQSDHTIWCWGRNDTGAFGNGTSDESVAGTPYPVRGPSLGEWEHVSTGWLHSCGIAVGGDLYCWGQGTHGQLGAGDTGVLNANLYPNPIYIDEGYVTVTSGEEHNCGLKDDGSLWCWGNDYGGAVGIDGPDAYVTTPTRVGEEGDVWLDVAAGWLHTCAVKDPGGLYCWGVGDVGQTGPDAAAEEHAPIAVDSASDWVGVTAGEKHTCARKANGTLWCFGDNSWGVLGDGTQDSSATPVQVGTGTDWLGVGAGSFHSCAANTSGQLWCWGANSYGQVGDGSGVDANWPVGVSDPTPSVDWESVTADKGYTCGVKDGGARLCWGLDVFDTLGLGAGQEDQSLPSALSGETLVWSQIDAGQLHACGVAGGELLCWGEAPSGSAGVPTHVDGGPPYPSDWAEASAGQSFSCARKTSGALRCWGSDTYGQLGDGDDDDGVVDRFVDSSWVDDWDAVTSGWVHSCALDGDGKAWCWGWGTAGQTGPNAADVQATPAEVGDAFTWTALATAHFHTCGIRDDKTLWCWGQSNEGELGPGVDNFTDTPTQVGTDDDWVSLATGKDHTCAIKDDQSLWCWGLNADGQLGDGSFTSSDAPVTAGDPLKDWASVTAGDDHTCAVDASGALSCWGAFTYGQLGTGPAWRVSPVRVLDPEDVR